MRRRTLLLALACPGTALAQSPAPARPSAPPSRPSPPRPTRPNPPPTAARPAPAAPTPAPPPVLPPPPALNEPPVPLAPDLAALPGGGWRLRFDPGSAAIAPAAAASLREIAARLAERSAGRVTLFAEARDGAELSAIRRLSLERARAAKALLEAGGLDGRRVDIRALGRTPLAADVLDLLPPTVARP